MARYPKRVTAEYLTAARAAGKTAAVIAAELGVTVDGVRWGFKLYRIPPPAPKPRVEVAVVRKVRKAREQVANVAPRAGAHNPFGL